MIIEVDPLSKRWIEGKGKALTIKMLNVQSCCAPGIQEMIAVPGTPKTLERFSEFKVDGLSIFVQKNIRANERLTLKLSGFTPFKTMSVKAH